MYTVVLLPLIMPFFHVMESVGVLDPDDEIDLFALQCLYLPRINNSLEEFNKAWNKHSLRGEWNWSPYKIWAISVLCNEIEVHISDLEFFNLDEEGPFADEQMNTLVVPETLETLSEEAKGTFVQQLSRVTANIADVDLNVDFLEVKAILIDLLETSSDSSTD